VTKLFMVFVLFLNSNGTLDVMQTVDKCDFYSAYHAAGELNDPAFWKGAKTVPIDAFVLPYSVSESEWEKHCFDSRYRAPEILDFEDKLLLLPKPQCP
jgi:hypothetical protein